MKWLFKIQDNGKGFRAYWFFNKFKISFNSYKDFMFTKGNSSIWIDIPYVEIKIKRNYKGHFIS